MVTTTLLCDPQHQPQLLLGVKRKAMGPPPPAEGGARKEATRARLLPCVLQPATSGTTDSEQSVTAVPVHAVRTMLGAARSCNEDAYACVPVVLAPPPAAQPSSSSTSSSSSSSCAGGQQGPGEQALPLSFYGVFDGHGGGQVSNLCARRLHRALAASLCSNGGGAAAGAQQLGGGGVCQRPVHDGSLPLEAALRAAFRAIDEEASSSVDASSCGSTACVALVGESRLAVAHCGEALSPSWGPVVHLPTAMSLCAHPTLPSRRR